MIIVDLKAKIEKRTRKRLDYDSARRELDKAGELGKEENSQMLRARDKFEKAKDNFDLVDGQLHDNLPVLYETGAVLLLNKFKSICGAEVHCQTELAKVSLVAFFFFTASIILPISFQLSRRTSNQVG
jgi:hypothetical protein